MLIWSWLWWFNHINLQIGSSYVPNIILLCMVNAVFPDTKQQRLTISPLETPYTLQPTPRLSFWFLPPPVSPATVGPLPALCVTLSQKNTRFLHFLREAQRGLCLAYIYVLWPVGKRWCPLFWRILLWVVNDIVRNNTDLHYQKIITKLLWGLLRIISRIDKSTNRYDLRSNIHIFLEKMKITKPLPFVLEITLVNIEPIKVKRLSECLQ